METKNVLSESLLAEKGGADTNADTKAMEALFRSSGMGETASVQCARTAVSKNICTTAKLRLMVAENAIRLEEFGMDKYDAELVFKNLVGHNGHHVAQTRSAPVAQNNQMSAPTSSPASGKVGGGNSSSSSGNDAAASDCFEGLSPGISTPLCSDATITEHCALFCLSWYCPCFPLGAAKAALEERQVEPFDYCFPPNLYQTRQQYRYRYLGGGAAALKAEDYVYQDFAVACCCGPCGVTQMAIEMGKKTGTEPIMF